MRHQAIRPGMLVSLRGDARERVANQDLDGKYFQPVMRVADMFVTQGYREPWIVLEGYNARLRAKDLSCGGCGGRGARRDIPARFAGTSTCPECGGAS